MAWVGLPEHCSSTTRIDDRAISPAQAVNLIKVATITNVIARRQEMFTGIMQSRLWYVRVFKWDYVVRFVYISITGINDEKLSPKFLPAKYKADHVGYIKVCKVMIKHEGVPCLLYLYIFVKTSPQQKLRTSPSLMTQIATLHLRRTAVSWFRPINRLSSSIANLYPSTWKRSRETWVRCSIRLLLGNLSNVKSDFRGLQCFCKPRFNKQKYSPTRFFLFSLALSFVLTMMQGRGCKAVDERECVENTTFFEGWESFQSYGEIFFE